MADITDALPNLLTPAQCAALQSVFDQVCEEFAFTKEDREARNLIAEALISGANARHPVDQALREGRAAARRFIMSLRKQA